MEKIRKGNDIEVLWAIYAGEGVNEAPYDLTGKNLSLYLNGPLGRKEVYGFTIDRHILRWMFWGKEQQHLGSYSLELVENEGMEGMHTVDECDAFQLVKRSCEVGSDNEGRVECIHLQFRSSMSVGYPAIGAEMEIDSSLSLVSENPVQNKVITLALQEEQKRAQDAESRLEKIIEDNESRITLVERSLELMEDSLLNITTKIETLEDRLSKVETGDGSEVLTKVEENTEAIDILNGDETIVGSVDYKIKQAVKWAVLN